MELLCCVQKYDWGKLGTDSWVAQLARKVNNEEIDPASPYAELWMGGHPAGPSRLKKTGLLLEDYIGKNPDTLGAETVQAFGTTLPFLFKVLSVRKALSVQAHPSKTHAEELFKNHPDIYKDPNHKPELAIAVTDFKALCGFRPRDEIENFLREIPQLIELIGREKIDGFLSGEDGVRGCFEALMTCSKEEVLRAIESYLLLGKNSREKDLVLELNKQFPGDVGALCVFWLNFVTLAPGEALYLGPNEPHAYLSGDCVECMANSDNVVRAGLTPKFRDVKTLCEMLTYQCYHPNDIKFQPIAEDQHTQVFKPPVKDFAVAMITIPANTTYSLIPRASASILLNCADPAQVLFLRSRESIEVSAPSEMRLYQAFCNV